MICLNVFAADTTGTALLDKYVLSFKGMAEKGTGGREIISESLAEMMAEAKKASAEDKIDPVFFRRYRRLLMVTKLAIVEDREGILGDLIQQEVGGFIADKIGEWIDLQKDEQPARIGAIADALANEVLDLHLYLENKEKKAKMMEDFYKNF